MPKISMACDSCGKVFKRYPSQGGRYCSYACLQRGATNARLAKLRATAVERFWQRVDKVVTPNNCWPWVGGTKTKEGYGIVSFNGKIWLSHRLAYDLCVGPPGSLCVLHSCDTPPCCRPDHLFLGTRVDNNHDKMTKGRHVSCRGEANPNAKLSRVQVDEIRRRYAAGGVRQVDLAVEFGVNQTLISGIVRGTAWT